MSTLIVRNFNAVNGRRFMPSLVCRKKTGPGDSRLIRIAAITKTGAVKHEENGGADDIDDALRDA